VSCLPRVLNRTQIPGAANDPTRILNITVLDVQSDWGITQVYPWGAGLLEPVAPEETMPLEFEAFLPDHYTESIDTLKVFATQATMNFLWLELPARDQPDMRTRPTRAAIVDPLEQILAAVTGEETASRAIRLTGPPQDKGWGVTQVELRVQR
jgi:hypothetical protein